MDSTLEQLVSLIGRDPLKSIQATDSILQIFSDIASEEERERFRNDLAALFLDMPHPLHYFLDQAALSGFTPRSVLFITLTAPDTPDSSPRWAFTNAVVTGQHGPALTKACVQDLGNKNKQLHVFVIESAHILAVLTSPYDTNRRNCKAAASAGALGKQACGLARRPLHGWRRRIHRRGPAAHLQHHRRKRQLLQDGHAAGPADSSRQAADAQARTSEMRTACCLGT
jgi:hypothetical protein